LIPAAVRVIAGEAVVGDGGVVNLTFVNRIDAATLSERTIEIAIVEVALSR